MNTSMLQIEADTVSDELGSLLGERIYAPLEIYGPLNRRKTLDMFKKLEPLLGSGDPHCLNFISALRRIPGTAELIQEMEDFYFGEAAITFCELKEHYLRRGVMNEITAFYKTIFEHFQCRKRIHGRLRQGID